MEEINIIKETAEPNVDEVLPKDKTFNLPLVPLRGKVLLPKTVLNFDVGRPQSADAVNASEDGLIFLTAQKNAFIDAPKKGDLYKTGVIARIKSVGTLSNGGGMKLTVQALTRAKITAFTSVKPYFSVDVCELEYKIGDKVETEAHYRVARNAFLEYTLLDKRITKEMLAAITELSDPNDFIDNCLSVLPFKVVDVQDILETDDTTERLKKFRNLVSEELEIAKLEKKISAKVRESIDDSQKEYFLREQLKAIHEELGDADDSEEELEDKILAKKMPKEIEEKALKEVERMSKMNPSSPDYTIILNYIDTLLELPFGKFTKDTASLSKAKEILDSDHFGLLKVKERIVEYLAVLKLTEKIKGPILCFVGPPGVGKTSVAKSIARALGRKFVRMSLGGVRDEAEIRGHRRTYVGAMPGRIIYGLKTAGTSNPVFLLDEIDKLSSDIHGDPASALLEVLDPEQNSTFRDRYMEIPYDLSKVMFITTANSVDTIPYPLLDRMEIIELNGYTDAEKMEIAKRYLVPKELENNGITDKQITLTDGAIKELIEGYTMEAGVRNLEREIGSVIRKVATEYAEKGEKAFVPKVVDRNDVAGYLGAVKYRRDKALLTDETGAATGLAWTAVGGTTLTIEVSLMKGKGEILLTGKLGDVMKESARTAISYIRARAKDYGIDEDRFSKTDIHIHVPEGATPKDGPSAGITMATAILSAFIDKKVKKSVAMTGEITLRGNVLPIGGLKEKALAAYRLGITDIIIPEDNLKDEEDIPAEIRNEITFYPVRKADEVFKIAFKEE